MMNYGPALQALNAELEKLNRIIASLEAVIEAQAERRAGRRVQGRKFMSPEEREDVSARMKRYWARKRLEKQKS